MYLPVGVARTVSHEVLLRRRIQMFTTCVYGQYMTTIHFYGLCGYVGARAAGTFSGVEITGAC